MEKIFWAVIIAIGLWAALTPGRQLKFLPENKYRVKLPPIVYIVAFSWLAYAIFIKTK